MEKSLPLTRIAPSSSTHSLECLSLEGERAFFKKKKHTGKKIPRPMTRFVRTSLGGSLLWFQLCSQEGDPP